MKEEIRPGFTRITTIASAFVDMKSIPPDVLKNAGERGTRVHAACDAIIVGDDFGVYPDSDAGYIESFKKWYVGKVFLPKMPRIYDEGDMLTGEIDLMYRCPKRGLVLVDLKTSAKESKSWQVQAGGYLHLLDYVTFDEIGEVEFIKLSKDESYPKIYNYAVDTSLFYCCFNTWKHYYKDQEQVDVSDYL